MGFKFKVHENKAKLDYLSHFLLVNDLKLIIFDFCGAKNNSTNNGYMKIHRML